MAKPVLLVVDDHPADLERVRAELLKRYGGDYDIRAEASPQTALERLRAGDPVVIIFAPLTFAATSSGIDFLDQVGDLRPFTRRVLLIPHGNRSTTKPILRAVTLGKIDRFSPQLGAALDEQFHALVSELLAGWQRQTTPPRRVVTIIGRHSDPNSYLMRDLLGRSALPFDYHEADSASGQALLEQVGAPAGPFPVLIRHDGYALINPTLEQVAVAFGVRHSKEEGVFDLAIVGAGPAGLSAAVYGGSEGLRTIVFDRDTFGGQAGTTSLIRNYLGYPFGITGADLMSRALDQAWTFGVETSVLREVVDLRAEDQQHRLIFADGTQLLTRAVVLAMGASYRRLEVPALEALVGAGVYYGGGVTEAQALAGKTVFVVGAGNSAGQAAVFLAHYARQVIMLVRASSLTTSMSDYLIREIEAAGNIDVRFRTVIADGGGSGRLEYITVQSLDSSAVETLAAAALFVLIGAKPRTEWLPAAIQRDPQGFILTGSDVVRAPHDRAPFLLETSLPGVFAAGDVRLGSVKRVAAAVGEGGMAIQSVHRYLAALRLA